MIKPWYKNYPNNVAHEIDLLGHNSLLDLFHQNIEKYQNEMAFSNFDSELSFKGVERLSRNFAAYLQKELKIKKGDRVALMCPNTLCFPIAMWGIIRAGGVQVNVNPMYTARELQHQLNDAQVETIIIFSASTKILAESIQHTSIKNIITVELDDLVNKGLPTTKIDDRLTTTSFTKTIMRGHDLTLTEPNLSTDDLLFLQYTGGTTGLSKGAMLTHGNIMANVLQYREFAKHHIAYGKEVVLTAIPMYHIFALTVNALCYFFFGAKNILVTNPRDMPAFVDTWKKNKITFFTGVNTLFNGLLRTPGFSKVDFSHLKLTVGGGATVQKSVADKWLKVTGVQLSEGYGLSETSPILTLNISDINCPTSGIGIPVPSTDISIRDNLGHTLPQGKAGELCAKGPQVMSGYWNNMTATRDVMTNDGYFKTGDIAIVDELGFFHVIDRLKDMIIVSGFNVYPNEVEEALTEYQLITEAAVIGEPDDISGEKVCAYVAVSSNVSEAEIISHCRKLLTAYKVPKKIVIVDELPKSAVGKILRRELRAIKN